MKNFQCKACIAQGIPNTENNPNVCGPVSIDKIFDWSDSNLKWQLAYKWHVVAFMYQELEALEEIIQTSPNLQNAISTVDKRTGLLGNIEYQLQIIEDIQRRLEKENPVT